MPKKTGQAWDRLTRRQFLSRTAATAGCLAVSGAHRLLPRLADATAPGSEAVSRTHTASVAKLGRAEPRVIHVLDPLATTWDYATGWYGDYVNQTEVNKMVDAGVMALTEFGTVKSPVIERPASVRRA